MASKPLGNLRTTGKEQFYTPKGVAMSIFATVSSLIPHFQELPFLEPAGGTGTIIEAALQCGISSVISFDIEPLHPAVRQGDFLEQQLSITNALTVSNPPFGRNNALAIPFFNHAAKFSEYIVLIVPRSWRKWSVQNRLDPHFHLIQDDDLTTNYVNRFGEDEHAKNRLRTCVQYWKRAEVLRPIIHVRDMGIISRCSPAEADASMTIFGYGCGTLKLDFEPVKNTTQMFIKFGHPRAQEAIENSDFSRFYLNTAYTEALSMAEINYVLNTYIFGDPYIVESY